MQATLRFVGVKTVGTLCKEEEEEEKEVRGFYKCVHTLFAHTECFYVIYSYTLLSTPSAPALSTFHFPSPLPSYTLQPARLRFLSSFIFSIHFVCREEFYMKLRRTFRLPLPLSHSRSHSHKDSLAFLTASHRTAPHLHHSSAHILYAAIHKHVIRTHTRTKAALVLFLVGKKKKTH